MTSDPHPWWVPTRFTCDRLLEVLDVRTGEGERSVEVPVLPSGHGGVLGAQMLGQAVAAAESCTEGASVRSVGLMFLRASRDDEPLRLELSRLSSGRRLTSFAVEFRQGGAVVAHGDLLLGTDPPGDGGLAVREPGAPGVPAASVPSARALWPWEVRSPSDPAPPGHERVWARVPGSPGERLSRSLFAFATESLTIPLAVDARGQRDRGGELAQAVVAHRTSFCGPADASRWHLFSSRLVADGPSGVLGCGDVLDAAGDVVATTETHGLLG